MGTIGTIVGGIAAVALIAVAAVLGSKKKDAAASTDDTGVAEVSSTEDGTVVGEGEEDSKVVV
jgi:hypothetical protein